MNVPLTQGYKQKLKQICSRAFKTANFQRARKLLWKLSPVFAARRDSAAVEILIAAIIIVMWTGWVADVALLEAVRGRDRATVLARRADGRLIVVPIAAPFSVVGNTEIHFI